MIYILGGKKANTYNITNIYKNRYLYINQIKYKGGKLLDCQSFV